MSDCEEPVTKKPKLIGRSIAESVTVSSEIQRDGRDQRGPTDLPTQLDAKNSVQQKVENELEVLNTNEVPKGHALEVNGKGPDNDVESTPVSGAFDIDLIMDQIFKNLTVDSLLHCRIINSRWKSLIDNFIRREDRLSKVADVTCADRLIDFLLNWKDTENLFPVSRFQISIQPGMMKIPTFRKFVLSYGQQMKHVTIQEKGEVLDAVERLNILLDGANELESMVMDTASCFECDFISNAEPEKARKSKVTCLDLKLDMFKCSEFVAGLLRRLPNIKTLKLNDNGGFFIKPNTSESLNKSIEFLNLHTFHMLEPIVGTSFWKMMRKKSLEELVICLTLTSHDYQEELRNFIQSQCSTLMRMVIVPGRSSDPDINMELPIMLNLKRITFRGSKSNLSPIKAIEIPNLKTIILPNYASMFNMHHLNLFDKDSVFENVEQLGALTDCFRPAKSVDLTRIEIMFPNLKKFIVKIMILENELVQIFRHLNCLEELCVRVSACEGCDINLILSGFTKIPTGLVTKIALSKLEDFSTPEPGLLKMQRLKKLEMELISRNPNHFEIGAIVNQLLYKMPNLNKLAIVGNFQILTSHPLALMNDNSQVRIDVQEYQGEEMEPYTDDDDGSENSEEADNEISESENSEHSDPESNSQASNSESTSLDEYLGHDEEDQDSESD